jgi:hypothetical protein
VRRRCCHTVRIELERDNIDDPLVVVLPLYQPRAWIGPGYRGCVQRTNRRACGENGRFAEEYGIREAIASLEATGKSPAGWSASKCNQEKRRLTHALPVPAPAAPPLQPCGSPRPDRGQGSDRALRVR